MFWYLCSSDAEGVFENLEGIRVKIRLDDHERREAIAAIENLVGKIHDWYKHRVVKDIFYAVLKELFKSTVVDDDMIAKVIERHPFGTTSSSDDDMIAKVIKMNPLGTSSSSDDDDDDMIETSSDDDEDDDIRAENEVIMKPFAEEAMKDLEEQCRMMGCTLKKDQQNQILDRWISWYLDRGMRFLHYDDMQRCLKSFMNEVEYYIARSCVLDDLETVTKAIQVARLEAQKHGYFDGCEMDQLSRFMV